MIAASLSTSSHRCRFYLAIIVVAAANHQRMPSTFSIYSIIFDLQMWMCVRSCVIYVIRISHRFIPCWKPRNNYYLFSILIQPIVNILYFVASLHQDFWSVDFSIRLQPQTKSNFHYSNHFRNRSINPIKPHTIVPLHLPNLFFQITFSCSSLDSINHVQWHPGALMPQLKQQLQI